jgi:hypothetical protein
MSEPPENPTPRHVAEETGSTSTHRSEHDVPWRFALLVLAGYVVAGAVCGVLWEWIWTPPTQFVQQHQVFYLDYSSLRRVFNGTGLYVLISALASAAVAAVVCLLTRRHELVTLALVIVGSVAAALVMREVGYSLGPPDPLAAARHAADGTRLQGQLQVAGTTPLLVWPTASLVVTAIVFFVVPDSLYRGETARRASPAENDISGSSPG